jgi:rare lipoprotein A
VSVPVPAAPAASGPDTSALPAEPAPEAPAAEGEAGVATYYARRFDGRRTTSGAVYDPAKLTAAHQSLPFGTRVKVVNAASGREVVVTVNDRCRKRTFPFIDLSRAAARQLGFLGKGTAKVRIIVLDREKP